MKRKLTILTSVFLLSFCIIGCGVSKEEPLEEIKIASQIWASKNLNVSHFKNGDYIIETRNTKEWEKAIKEKTPAWCYYNNEPENGRRYGKLYNGFAVNDPRGLAPDGWHIPSDSEWRILFENLGGLDEAGNKIKSNIGWGHSGTETNSSGFNAFPAGHRFDETDSSFTGLGEHSFFWSSSTYSANQNKTIHLWDQGPIRPYSDLLNDYLSVRCIKD